jgi:hypothetical protein
MPLFVPPSLLFVTIVFAYSFAFIDGLNIRPLNTLSHRTSPYLT